MDLPVKAEQRLGVTIVALVFGPLFMAGPPVFCVWLALHSTGSTAALLLAGGILCGGWCGYHMIQNYHWVEFDGRRVRGKRFWTRVMVEHDVSDLVEIRPLVSVVKDATTVVTDALIGPCRGWEMVFRETQHRSNAGRHEECRSVDPCSRGETESERCTGLIFVYVPRPLPVRALQCS